MECTACIDDVVSPRVPVYSQSDGVDCLHAAVANQLKSFMEC